MAGCTPESADQFRVDTKHSSRRRTLSCGTFLVKQFYLQFLITPFSFNWHVRILNINSFEDQFLKQTENIDYCAKRQTDISIHCGKTCLAVVFWWMPLVFMKFNQVISKYADVALLVKAHVPWMSEDPIFNLNRRKFLLQFLFVGFLNPSYFRGHSASPVLNKWDQKYLH